MYIKTIWLCLTIVLTISLAFAGDSPRNNERVRVMSWNLSEDSFVTDKLAFQAVLRRVEADILLFDEVSPRADIEQLRSVLVGLNSGSQADWNIDYGNSGGRQRGVIASRMMLEALPEFSSILAYPEVDLQHISSQMSGSDRANLSLSMEHGIPVNGAIVLTGRRRLLVVIADLQCCGDDPGSWQEFRRRTEVREIRRLIGQVLARTEVDGIIVAGDFNIVNTAIPLVILTGPYRQPHSGLIPAELYHINGSSSWTWDGRGTPYPSRALDFQLYTPQTLALSSGYIFDSEDLSLEELRQSALEHKSSIKLSDHRPLVAQYRWR